MVGYGRQCRLLRRRRAVASPQHGLQQAVRHKIGIASDRAREMQVGRARKTEMRLAFRRILRLFHSPKHQHGDERTFGTAVRPRKDRLHCLGRSHGERGKGNRIVVAEFIQNGNDVDQIARVGRLVHTIDARNAGIAHDASNRFVRRNHRLFHKRGRVVSPSKID